MDYLKKRRGAFDPPVGLMRELRDLTWRYAGPLREEGSLNEGLYHLAALERKIEDVYPAALKDLFQKQDLENGALLLKAILKGSLLRKESRGSFGRRDYPNQDDGTWLKSSCYRLNHGEIEITHPS